MSLVTFQVTFHFIRPRERKSASWVIVGFSREIILFFRKSDTNHSVSQKDCDSYHRVLEKKHGLSLAVTVLVGL